MPTTLEPITVTDQDIAFYHENGYWISPKLIDDDQIARLRRAHERVWTGQRDHDAWYCWRESIADIIRDPKIKKLRKLDNSWWVNDEIKALVTSPVIGAIGARLLNSPVVRLWHDQLLWKPGLGDDAPPVGANVGWHQDYAYWQSSNTSNMCTAWIALQDVTIKMGCMRVVRGSNKWGLLDLGKTFNEQNLDSTRDQVVAKGFEWVEVPLELKAGTASFHHALTLHGSGPNFSNEPRLSVVAHMMPGDCAYQHYSPPHPNMDAFGPYVKEGNLFQGDWFPQMYPPANAV